MRFTLSASLALALTTAACARETTADTTEADAGATPAVAAAAAQDTAPAPQWDLPADAWRTADQEDLLYIETDHGMVIVEMAPEFAPNHVARMRTLAQERFYDFLVWHRVIDGFMAQGGGARSNPGHAADVDGLQAEFTVRRSGEPVVTELQDRMINPRSLPQMAKAGFWDGFPAGTQTAALAAITGDGQVQSWLLHCTGAAAAARTGDPNSARSQFYITRGNPEHLNAQYTAWGRVRVGQEAVDAIAVGSAMDDPDFRPDNIRSMRTGDELPAEAQVTIEVADTDSAAFAAYLDTLRDPSGNLPDICDITVPTRIVE
ncbi:peptidylprolyl isomerase [Maricaulis maris]|uniref:peptidylprolyl isomerase n=1 Tax=Maricaulis maris TaxID=74318 RepID=UPI003B8B3E89